MAEIYKCDKIDFRNFVDMFESFLNEIEQYSMKLFDCDNNIQAQLIFADESVYKYFFKEDDKIIGFVCLSWNSEYELWYIGQFYIKPEFRRSGKGLEVARQLCSRIKKDFFMIVQEKNVTANRFWDKVLADFIRYNDDLLISSEPEKANEIRVYRHITF